MLYILHRGGGQLLETLFLKPSDGGVTPTVSLHCFLFVLFSFLSQPLAASATSRLTSGLVLFSTHHGERCEGSLLCDVPLGSRAFVV